MAFLPVCWIALAACGKAAPPPVEERATTERTGDRVTVHEGSPLRARLKIEPVGKRDVRRHLAVPAAVEAEPARLAKIAPPLAGRISKLHVRFGEEVKSGQPLFELTSPDMASAQADSLRAQSSLSQADRNLARQKDLADHGIGAKRELEQAQTDRELARDELERAHLRLQVLGGGNTIGATLTVRSPIAGRVVDLGCAPGEFRNDLSAALMTVADLSQVWVTANVQEKDVRLVHQGDDATASFVAYPGEVFSGHVLLVGDLLDPDTRTIKVRVAFDNADRRLKPGMFATATFASSATPQAVVPTTALVLNGDKSFVFVEIAPFTFERRPVEPGDQQGDVTIVQKGISEGERVVAAGAVLLQ
ncbi:Cobalt/zinc/cadmium efflux RND transporter, membrane fusion protein, CzcB family protein [Minicystis rosea]|nr:Cobalt/zinc/cadmium efflux RND transporter, membrane fusion protein, CzcB family protein [Minicystis rosea]